MLSFFCSEEGNQAHAKHVFGFTRTYNEKIRKREARLTAKLAGFSSLKEERNQATAKHTVQNQERKRKW